MMRGLHDLVMAIITLPDFWCSQIIIFKGDGYFERGLATQNDFYRASCHLEIPYTIEKISLG